MSKFSIPLDQLAEKMKLDVETVARKATLDLFRAITLAVPVDTGRFRANMNVSQGAIDATTTQSVDKGRADREIEKVLSLPLGGVTYISNSLPYAVKLEYGGYPNPPKHPTGKTANGYSIQAPQGMFRINAMRYSDYVKKAIEK